MDASIGLTHFTSSAIVVYAMNRLKAASWFPLIQKEKATMNRIFSVVIAFAVSIGIHYTWDPTARIFALTLPTLSALGLGVWHWINQYAMQETLYQITNNKTPSPAVSIANAPIPGRTQYVTPKS